MEQDHTEIAQRVRRRAFRSRNPRAAIKLLALADQLPSMHLPNAAVILVDMRRADRHRPIESPAQRQARARRRQRSMARPLNSHPLILERLGELYPKLRNKPAADLRDELFMDDDAIEALADAIEHAWGPIDRRAAADWRTVADVTATIATAQDAAA